MTRSPAITADMRADVVEAVHLAGPLLYRAKGRHETMRRRQLLRWLAERHLEPTLAELEAARHAAILEDKDHKRARLRANQRSRREREA
jgi:truncated hemoglobin YjbI